MPLNYVCSNLARATGVSIKNNKAHKGVSHRGDHASCFYAFRAAGVSGCVLRGAFMAVR